MSLQPVDYVNTCRHKVPRAHGIQVFLFQYSNSFILVMGVLRTWNWEFALALEEGGVGVDEFVRLDVANGYARHYGGVARCV